MATHDTYSWPIIWSACESLGSSPAESLAVLQAAKWETDWIPAHPPDPISPDVGRRILKDPGSYPWYVLEMADASIDQSRDVPHLLDVAGENGWFEADDE
jgi:hypothetical protein